MKPLNSEATVANRSCQLAVAENYRKDASLRGDVVQTTDLKAFNEMFEYIKSDANTLDIHENSKIANFYAERSVFITGASGFVGKVRRILISPNIDDKYE